MVLKSFAKQLELASLSDVVYQVIELLKAVGKAVCKLDTADFVVLEEM